MNGWGTMWATVLSTIGLNVGWESLNIASIARTPQRAATIGRILAETITGT